MRFPVLTYLLFASLQFSSLLPASRGAAHTVARRNAVDSEESLTFCRTMRSLGVVQRPVYAANLAVLMDSWDYRNLLPPRIGAVWQQIDLDDNNPPRYTTHWVQNSNTPCQQTVHVCGYAGGMQNNWLITQLINRTIDARRIRLSQVSIMIELELRDCDVMLNCQRTFSTHVYETSTEDNTAAGNTNNYRRVKRVSPVDTSGNKVNITVDVNFNTNHSSFYFAIQDETSCMVVTRIIVYYHVCPDETSEMIIHPQTVAPPISRASIPQLISATCVDNASPIPLGGQRPTVKCNEGGVWSQIPGLGCVCDLGYVSSFDKEYCVVCPNGQYFSSYTDKCDDCPDDTDNSSNDTNTTLKIDSCACRDGYFLPRRAENNATCVAVQVVTTNHPKKKETSSTNLTIVLPTIFVLVGVTLVLFASLYLYKQHTKQNGRVYRVNGTAPWENGQVSIENDTEDASTDRMRESDERPNQLRQVSTASTRSNATSFKTNIAYFLFKIFGSQGQSQAGVTEPTERQTSRATTMDASPSDLNRTSSTFTQSDKDGSMIALTSFGGLNSEGGERHDYINGTLANEDLDLDDDSRHFRTVNFTEWGYVNVPFKS